MLKLWDKKTSKTILIYFLFIFVYSVLFYLSFSFQHDFTLNLNPVPNRYVINFIDGLQQEEKELSYYNWMKDGSQILFPLRTSGDEIKIRMRAKRFIAYDGFLYVFAGGNRVYNQTIQSRQYEIIEFSIPREFIDGKDLNLYFRILSNETKRNKGMRLDWIKAIPGSDSKILPTDEQFREFIIFLILNIILFMLLFEKDWQRLIWQSVPILIFLLANSIFRVESSLLVYHISRWVYIPSIACMLIFKYLSYRNSSRNITSVFKPVDYFNMGTVFYLSLLVRIAGMFYYQSFYPDLRSYFKYMTVLDEQGFLGFAFWYAYHHLEILYNFRTPFPYSPLFHFTLYPFTKLSWDYYVWLRLSTAVINSLFVLLVYILIKKLFKDHKPALFGSLFLVFSKLLFFRIFLCMYSSLFSAFLTLAAMIYILLRIDNFNEIRTRWTALILTTLALLSYPSGFLNMMLFLAVLIISLSGIKLKRQGHAKLFNPLPQFNPVLKIAVIAFLMAFFIYYVYFVYPIITELIPFLLNQVQGEGSIYWNEELQVGFFSYLLHRINFYLSIPGILLVIPGIYLLFRSNLEQFRKKYLASWFLTWFIIYILAAPQLFSFLFRLGKECLFIIPLFAVAAGLAAARLWDGGKLRKFLVVVIFLCYIAISLFEWTGNMAQYIIFIE